MDSPVKKIIREPAFRKIFSMRPGRFFIIISLLLFLVDALFIAINYWSDQKDLNRALLQKGLDDETTFHLALKSEADHMRLMASYFANTPEVQNLFLQGRRAVEAEGGGPGGQKAEQIRHQLLDLVSIGWEQITKDYNLRQLHFHLPPGDISYLRVHSPEKYGDDLSAIRYSVVYTNTSQQPSQGLEAGRAKAGIRGVVPVFATDPDSGDVVHVGALEAGNSFLSMIGRLSGETKTSYAVLLKTDLVKKIYWPELSEKLFKQHPPVGQWFIESTNRENDLRTLLDSQRVLDALSQRKPVLIDSSQDGPITLFSFPLRDFQGEQDSLRPDIGTVVSWSDASSAVAAISKNLSTNLTYGIGGYLLVEMLLYVGWGFALGRLHQVIEDKTAAINNVNRDLREEVRLRTQSEHLLAKFKSSLEQQVTERTNELAETVDTLKREVHLRRTAEKQMYSQRESFHTTLQSIGDGVIAVDTSCKINYMNPAASRLLGWTVDEAISQEISTVFDLEADNPYEQKIYTDCLSGIQRHSINQHHRLLAKTGKHISIEHSVSPILGQDDTIKGLVIVFRDVSKTEEMTKELNYQATHDRLTGLFNRNYFEQSLQEALNDAHANDNVHAFLYMDLDQFKIVNDTSGHVAGDELLQQLGTIFQKHIRRSDTLARLGGDEFGLLLTSTSLTRARATAEHLLQLVRDFRFVWSDKSFSVGMSIGITLIDKTTPSLEQLMSEADSACYIAKDRGRNRLYALSPDDNELLVRQDEMLWVNKLEQAIHEDRFVLYAQPVMPSTIGAAPKHYEILVRMIDEDGELIPPGSFIPAAERYGIMAKIDFWIISQAFREIAAFQAIGHLGNDTIININLSGNSLGKNDLHDFIVSEFALHNINPKQICFEITETSAIANMSEAFALMQALRQMGVKFALDDFGSGLSSFAYLKMLPVDFLKIDGSFVKNINNSETDQAMVHAINMVGHSLHLKTIAEYAESDEAVALLKSLGVDYVQGYSVGRPQPFGKYIEAA